MFNMNAISKVYGLLFALLCISSLSVGQNPVLTVKGRVFQLSGPVPNHDVRIRFLSNDPLDTTVVTDTMGRFSIEKELINRSVQGAFSFILEDCNKTVISRTRNWDANQHGYSIEENIEICVDTSGNCNTRIVMLPNPSGGFNLAAVTNSAFSYQWSTGATTQIIQVTQPDIYCVTVTDTNGCRSTDCINVNVTDVQNCGVNIRLRFSPDPSIVRLEASARGSGSYSIKWSTGDTTNVINVTQPGRYCVFLVDNNTGCRDSACFEVRPIHFGQGTDCSVWFSTVSLGGTQFLLRALNNRPQEPVSYLWSTGQTTETILVNSPGTYCITATFNDGCKDVFCGPVIGINPTQCTVDIQTELIDPIGLWRVTAVPSGGNFASINWSNGAQTMSTEILGPATVCLSVVYENGCRAKRCLRLSEGSISFTNDDEFRFQSRVNTVYPNPFKETFFINYHSDNSNQTVDVLLLDMMGKVRYRHQELAPGKENIRVDTNHLPAGAYLLKIVFGEETQTFKVLKE
jgi:hypothetical protein